LEKIITLQTSSNRVLSKTGNVQIVMVQVGEGKL